MNMAQNWVFIIKVKIKKVQLLKPEQRKSNIWIVNCLITALFPHRKHHFTATAHLNVNFRNYCKSVHCNNFLQMSKT